LIELLIVTTILPLVIGGLAVGIVAVFKLQSSVSNRLGDTFDSQQISGIFSKDITAAQFVTTDAATNPQCGAGTGTLLLTVDENSDRQNGTLPVVSYFLVPNAGSSPATFNFERLSCLGENPTTLQSTQILAYDVASNSQLLVNCPGTTCSPDPTQGWVPAKDVNDISYTVTEQKTSYAYTLAASPVGSINSNQDAIPPTDVVAGTSCNTESSTSGPLASNLCLVDFGQLATNPALWLAATTPGSCAPMSATVGNSDVLYFCLSVSVGDGTTSGAAIPFASSTITAIPASSMVTPSACVADGITNSPSTPCFGVTSLPTYSSAFLGRNEYTDVAGDPALWVNGYKYGNQVQATVTLTNIHLNNPQGQAATGWQLFSADAESTNTNPEFITWTTTGVNSFNQPVTLQPICNQEAVDNCFPVSGKPLYYHYWGNACADDGSSMANFGIVPITSTNPSNPAQDSSEIECLGQAGSSGAAPATTMTGVGMVEAVTPTNLTVTFGGTNGSLQAVAIGLVLSGLSS